MSAREDVLAEVRSAIRNAGHRPDPPYTEIPRHYRRASGRLPGSPEVVQQFVAAVEKYGAEVMEASNEAELNHCLSVALADCQSVVVPTGLPIDWVKVAMAQHRVYLDGGGALLTNQELDGIDAVLSSSRLAIASTGTIILDGAPDQGRRALSLIPDQHVVVVRTDRIVETVPEAFAILEVEAHRPLTWIAGPSATSDIELSRVEGVHGPRTLKVVLNACEETR